MEESTRSKALTLAILPICLYLVIAPVWFPALAARMYDNARLLQLGVLALVVLLLSLRGVRNGVTEAWFALGRLPRALLAVMIAAGAISASFSAAPHLGALEVALMTQLVVLFLVVNAAVRELKEKAESTFVVAIACGAALVGIKFWVTQVSHMLEGKPFQWVSPFLDFANVRFFNQYQAYALLLIPLAAALPGMSRNWRIAVYVVAANFWALQWMAGSRAVWTGAVVGAIMVIALARRGRLAWLGQQTLMVVSGGLIYLLFSQLVASAPGATAVPGMSSAVEFGSQSDTDRIAMVSLSLKMLGEHPLLGIGPGQWGLNQVLVKNAHPHNAALQLLSEYGLLAGTAGVALVILLLLFAVKTLREQTREIPAPATSSLCAALFMGLTDSMFSGNLIMSHSQILLFVIAGWLVGQSQKKPEVMNERNSGWRLAGLTLGGVAMLAMCTTAILAFEYVDVVNTMPGNLQPRYPHFWQYGRFAGW
ncbi:MAG TPA: O-antigen ligase family protein [Burkholderiales bacterium]|nr:O-antigen ligase family protein [Burkholderiales bacterium]